MRFEYKAFTQEGEFKRGIVSADSKEEALRILQEQGLFVTYLGEPRSRLLEIFSRKPGLNDIYLFSRQLSYLIKARTPLDEAVKSLSETSQNFFFRDILIQIYNDLISGVPFSKSLERFPEVFDAYFVGMIKIGETVGTLDETLNYLSKHLENQIKFRNKALQALIYPAIVFAMFIVVMLVLFYFVIPQITRMFVENNIPLPTITKIFQFISDFILNFGFFFLIIVFAFFYYLFKYFRTKEGRKIFFEFINYVPFLSPLFKNIYTAQFLESLFYLTKGGVPLVEALAIIRDSIAHPAYEYALEYMIEEVKKGKPLSGAMEEFPELFPAIIIQAMRTAEKTGQMAEITYTLLEFYSETVETQFANLGEALQPFLILILGGGLGLLEASLLIPLLNLTKYIQNF
ncbi:MAG: type II secretion system F family protein [Candidatus Pacebacteria bacterium]|nr:type II secretion system F family protein [Candidatus Paceibacterota bacterium]